MCNWCYKKPEKSADRSSELSNEILSAEVMKEAIIFDWCYNPLPKQCEKHVNPSLLEFRNGYASTQVYGWEFNHEFAKKTKKSRVEPLYSAPFQVASFIYLSLC